MATLEGYLLKDGGWRRGWRKRYFKLGKVYFQYYENEGCTSPKGALVRGTILSVEVVNKTIFQFKIVAKETWTLQASDKAELIQWMETIIPNSAASLKQQPVITRPLPTTSVTACEATVEHDYAPLPEAMRNPRFSFSERGSEDEKPSPSPSPSANNSPIYRSPERVLRTVAHQGDVRRGSSARKYVAPPPPHSNGYSPNTLRATQSLPRQRSERRGSTHSASSDKSQTSNQTEDYLEPNMSPTPPPVPTTAPPPRPSLAVSDDDSSDEFFCFDDDVIPEYANDDEAATLRRESLKELSLNKPVINVQPDTPETLTRDTAAELGQFLSEEMNENMVPLAQPPNSLAEPHNTMPHSLSELHSRLASLAEPIESYETDKEGTPDERELPALDNNRLAPEVDESYEDMSPEPSPLPHRRSIKSKAPNNKTYSITCTDGAQFSQAQDSEEEEESPPAHRRNIKSADPGPVSLNVPVTGSSFLSTSPADGITTMRVNEWIKNTTAVPKEFDDPDEMDELDKYLMDHSMVLPREDIALLCKIGNGAFGEVWKARANPPLDGQELVAVKTLKEGSSDKNRQDFYGEAALLGQFKHPNVIALHGVVLREESPLIVIEFAENGALKSFLKKHGGERHSNQLLGYCRDIVRGMRYLSERGYIHRDLAARNVLLSKYECCKIADFGLSRKLGEEDDIYVSRGGMVAIKWTAPEAVLAASYSAQSDVWSAAVTMWEVFSVGANPFSGLANEDAFRNIRKGTRLTKPEKCPVDVYKVLLSCWESNPAERPTFARLETLLYDPCTDNIEQPIYENNDGQLQYVNISYENMQDVEQGS